MNEYIEIQFYRKGKKLGVRRQLPGLMSIELDEPDPMPRRVKISLAAEDELTRYRMGRVQQLQGWAPGEFKLKVSVEGGVIVLRGDDNLSLPQGRYQLRVGLEEAKSKPRRGPVVTIKEDGFAEAGVDIETDDREVEVDLETCDPEIQRVLDASILDGIATVTWLASDTPRPARKSCLMNLLACLRTRPTLAQPLIAQVESMYFVSNDRAYARVTSGLLSRLEGLSLDRNQPFYREGRPKADIHKLLVASIPAAECQLFSADRLVSFRGEGSPSLQVVVAEPPPGHPVAFAEFDLDLGNALQDVVGFVVHMGELLDGKATNHLDLRRKLAGKSAATRPFLYYTIAG
jgi:hypothetical protein